METSSWEKAMRVAVARSVPANDMAETILVVEDDVLVRLTLAEGLRDAGFTVMEAASADEALQLLASRTALDLLLTDVNMPGSMDGLALGRFVRFASPGVKVLVVSGRIPASAVEDAADAFIAKPYDLGRIVATVRRLLADLQS